MLTAPAGPGGIADELAQRPAQHHQEDHRHGQHKLADVATLWQDCSNGAGQKHDRQRRRSGEVSDTLKAAKLSKPHPGEAAPVVEPADEERPEIVSAVIANG